MTNKELRFSVATRPFVPFRIHMLGGRTFDVKHPDFVMVHPGDRTFVFYDYDVRAHRILDLLHVQEVEYGLPAEQDEPAVPADAA